PLQTRALVRACGFVFDHAHSRTIARRIDVTAHDAAIVMPMTFDELVTMRYATGILRPWPREIRFSVRAVTFVIAFVELVLMDLRRARSYRHVRRAVAGTRLATKLPSYDGLALVRCAVRDAGIFYFKKAHCLQRSAAVTRMLRRRGYDVQMVVGC